MKLKKFFLLSVMLGLSFPAFCDGNSSPTKPPSQPSVPVVIEPVIRPGNRPKAPAGQNIEGFYTNGYLLLDFAIPEGECSMTVTSPLVMISNICFDSSYPVEIFIGYHSDALIEIYTDNGNVYEGYLTTSVE